MFICNYFKKPLPIKEEMKNTNKYIEFNIDKEFTNNECIICLGVMKISENIIMIYCGHKYHKDCLLEWFKKKKICPECDFLVE